MEFFTTVSNSVEGDRSTPALAAKIERFINLIGWRASPESRKIRRKCLRITQKRYNRA